MAKKSKPILSIIILSYNTRKLLVDCLNSLKKVEKEVSFEVIVSDNGSSDASVKAVRENFPGIRVIENKANLGFAAGNNRARKFCRGKYILFLNSDTIVYPKVLTETIKYLEENPDVGALSCKLVLASGELDRDARRSFPTPWVALTHLILRLDRFFPKSRLLARYWYGYKSAEEISEVDVIQGAYFLSPKSVLDSVDWFDEAYFLDGEDIDLCWKIREKGLKIIYYPKVSILHLKGASKGKDGVKTNVSKKDKLKFRLAGVNSMEIFYRKHLWGKYPLLVNLLILLGINFMKAARILKVYLS